MFVKRNPIQKAFAKQFQKELNKVVKCEKTEKLDAMKKVIQTKFQHHTLDQEV